jgi:Cdc6-like AAA superfamily ATPase
MLDLMRICAEIAEAQGDKKIDMGHYRKAKERMEMDHCQELMDSIALMQRNLLVSLALLDEVEGIASPSTNQVYEKCQEQYGIAPSYRRAAGILKEMELTNLIGVRDVSRGRGGRSNEMWLKIPAHVVLEHAGIDWRRMKELRKAEKETEELRRRLEKRRR